MRKVMKLSISLPETVYEELVKSSEYNARTVSGEILFRIMRFNDVAGFQKVGTIQDKNSEKVKDTQEFIVKPRAVVQAINENGYADVIGWIEKINDPEYQSDSEERSKVGKMVKDAGLSYNARDKKLWRQEGEKWILIREF